MKDILWWVLNIFIIVCFMLLGIATADMYGQQLWVGAFGGLIAHNLLRMVLRNIRNYVF
jgi:hypothetical protein